MKLFNVLVLTFFLKSSFTYSQTQFINNLHGYALTLPAGWKQIPKQEVIDFANRIQNKLGYNEGFYPIKRASSGWEYPYILTNFMKGKLAESRFEEVADNYIKSSEMKKIETNLPQRFPDQIKQINFGEAYYDKVRKRLIIKAEAHVTGVGTVVAITTAFFSTKGILFFNFYESKKNFNNSINIYNNIVSSVKIN